MNRTTQQRPIAPATRRTTAAAHVTRSIARRIAALFAPCVAALLTALLGIVALAPLPVAHASDLYDDPALRLYRLIRAPSPADDDTTQKRLEALADHATHHRFTHDKERDAWADAAIAALALRPVTTTRGNSTSSKTTTRSHRAASTRLARLVFTHAPNRLNDADLSRFSALGITQTTLDNDELLTHARALESAHRNPAAAAAYRLYRSRTTDPAAKCLAAFHEGRALRRERQHTAAVAVLRLARTLCAIDPQTREKVLYTLGVSASRLTNWRDGTSAWLELAASATPTTSSLADDALVLAAEAHATRNDPTTAAALYRRVFTEYPASDMADLARFRVAFLALRAGDPSTARDHFNEAASRATPRSEAHAKARFFALLAQQRGITSHTSSRTDSTSANQPRHCDALLTLYRDHPLNYYGIAALHLFQQANCHAPHTTSNATTNTASNTATNAPSLDGTPGFPMPTKNPIAPDLAEVFNEPATALAQHILTSANHDSPTAVTSALDLPPRLRLIASLTTDDPDAARWLIERTDIATCHLNERCARTLIALALLTGDHVTAQWTTRRTLLKHHAGTLPHTPDEARLLRIAYPAAHHPAIKHVEQQRAIPPSLFRALIREESAYDATIVSWAGAHGLSQLMPATAREECAVMKRPYTGDDALLNPTTNLTIGAHHFSRLLKMFPKQVPLAIMSYNAGAGAVQRWFAQQRPTTLYEFVEAVPFEEPSKYVSRIISTWAVYRALNSLDQHHPQQTPQPTTAP